MVRPLVCLLASLAAAPVAAETIAVTAALSAGQEVPPPPNASGVGTLTGTFDTASRRLAWHVVYSGLTSPATIAHFHGPAPAGRVAPVAVLSPVGASPIDGTAVLSADQAAALLAGTLYFNIHTELNRGGELRGQVEAAVLPNLR